MHLGPSTADNVNVNQQIQISSDITNHQDKIPEFRIPCTN